MNQTDLMLALNYKLLESMEQLLKEHYGSAYTTRLTKSDRMYTLCTNNFLLMFSIPDMDFYLSFMVGQTGKQIAQDTKLIMMIFDYTEFQVMDDSYFDKDKDHLVFGSEAFEVRQMEIIVASGKLKCPMCDRIYPKYFIQESGVCKICEDKKDKMIWN